MNFIKKKLNKKDLFTYYIWKGVILFGFLFLLLLFSYKTIFPSKNFTYSFLHKNSLKNTIHNVSFNNNLFFYASTPQNFSKVKINIKFLEKNDFKKQLTTVLKKSYRAFFYPDEAPLTTLNNIHENKLISSGISVFIVSKNKKYPINNPITFESLGYNWNNIIGGKNIDLSNYKKQKLMTIDSTHPNGTFFKSDQGNYYYINNEHKRILKNIQENELQKISNPIYVNEESLQVSEYCNLKRNLLFHKVYSCTIPIKKISSFSGKDYYFEIKNIPKKHFIKEINIQFKKSINKNNFILFFSDLKKRLLLRFGYEKN